jgi:hypothetical protein
VFKQVSALIGAVDGCTWQVQPAGRDNRGLTWENGYQPSMSSVDPGLGPPGARRAIPHDHQINAAHTSRRPVRGPSRLALLLIVQLAALAYA